MISPEEDTSNYTALSKEVYEAYNRFRPEGPKPLFCYVPFNNMSFSFEGRVLACAYNQKVELGHYPTSSIRDMWFNSSEGDKLRKHMQHNDLSFGCKHCKYFFDNQKFSGLKPLVFDKYSQLEQINYPKVLEFELSNVCNLECVMCNGKVSSSIRTNRDKLPPIPMVYDDAFVKQLEEFIPHIQEAKFYGGEPFLIPIYHQIWDLILKLNPATKIFVITNGTTLNSRIKDLLERGNFDLAVSVDSPQKELLESIRLNTRHEVVMENINYLNNYCKGRNRNLVLSFTLMRNNWREFIKMVRFCNQLDAVLYVSYLKTPPHLAVWNLPVEELSAMLLDLKGENLPEDSYAFKNNKRCYEDLLVYLQNCIQTNQASSQPEVAPIQEVITETTDADATIEMTVIPPSPQNNTPAIVVEQYNKNTDYLQIVSSQMQVYLHGINKIENLPGFLNKTEAVINTYFQKDANSVYYYMSITPAETLYKDVSSFTELEMVNAISNLNIEQA